jgi:hypothetical protein
MERRMFLEKPAASKIEGCPETPYTSTRLYGIPLKKTDILKSTGF